LLLVGGALAGGGALASAQAVPADAFFRGFEPNGDFLLTIAGKEEPKAEILRSESARSYLILSSELASPILVNVPGGTVETVQLMKVARQPDGTVDLLADATLAAGGKFQVQGANIEFQIDGKLLQLRQRPYVLGLTSGTSLLASSPSYQKTAKGYAPDAGILKRLKAQKEPVRVLTFFGSWCPHCKRHLPLLLKVEQGLAGSKFQFDYYGLPHPFDSEPEAKKYGIDGVPTAILFVGGKEVGRIPASQWSNPEVALDLQLNGPGRANTR
jgi:thiol-disulfide isomerase/thioredoxin